MQYPWDGRYASELWRKAEEAVLIGLKDWEEIEYILLAKK